MLRTCNIALALPSRRIKKPNANVPATWLTPHYHATPESFFAMQLAPRALPTFPNTRRCIRRVLFNLACSA